MEIFELDSTFPIKWPRFESKSCKIWNEFQNDHTIEIKKYFNDDDSHRRSKTYKSKISFKILFYKNIANLINIIINGLETLKSNQ